MSSQTTSRIHPRARADPVVRRAEALDKEGSSNEAQKAYDELDDVMEEVEDRMKL